MLNRADIHRMMHGAAEDALANLDNAITISLPAVQGTLAELAGATQPLRTVSVQNKSHFWVYVNASSARPAASAATKTISPFTSSVFPVGATRFIEILVDVGPDGSTAAAISNETISVSASPIPTPAGQDVPIAGPSVVTVATTGDDAIPYTAAPAVGLAAVLNIPAAIGKKNRLVGLEVSYSSVPSTVGNVQVADGATVIFNADITQAGPIAIPLPPNGLVGTAGNAMTVTLSASASVLGKANGQVVTR